MRMLRLLIHPIFFLNDDERPRFLIYGNVEKSRQRRSRRFAVLTYAAYAPRVKTAAALLDGLF